MRIPAALFLLLLPAAAVAADGKNLGAVTGGEFAEAKALIDVKCSRCHNPKVVEEAMRRQRNMAQLVKQMENKGLVLTDKERRVLQHYWGKEPFKGK